jgi:hypothetical protein
LKHSVRQQYSNINLSHLWTAIQSSYSYDKLKQAEASWLYDWPYKFARFESNFYSSRFKE